MKKFKVSFTEVCYKTSEIEIECESLFDVRTQFLNNYDNGDYCDVIVDAVPDYSIRINRIKGA